MPGYVDSYNKIPFGYDPTEDNWGGPLNRGLQHLAYVGTNARIREVRSDAPVQTPQNLHVLGDSYIVGANPTGDWSSFNQHDIAVWGREATAPTNIGWQRFVPQQGYMVYNASESAFFVFGGSDWTEIQASGGLQRVTSDNSLSGTGTPSDPLSVVAQRQVQPDWNVTSPTSLAFIKNVPSTLRTYTPPPPPTPPLVLWQYSNFSGSRTIPSGRTAYSDHVGTVNLSRQARLANGLGIYFAGNNPELRIGLGITVTLTDLRTPNRVNFTISGATGDTPIPQYLYGAPGSIRRTSRIGNISDNTFSITMWSSNVDGGREVFSWSGYWYAGLYVDA